MDLCLSSKYYGPSVWGHSRGTERTAMWLAPIVNAAVVTSGISGLTHDLGSITEGRDGKNGEGHHRVGARKIKAIMMDLGYPRKIIYQVQYCIYSHRGSADIPRITLEARVVASADAINHFERIDELWQVGQRDRHLDVDETYAWLAKKLEKDWQKIMPEVRELVRDKYIKAWLTLMRLYAREAAC